MEKLRKLDLDELMEMVKDDMIGDSMPYSWSIPVHCPGFTWTVYEDNLNRMANHLTNKYEVQAHNRRQDARGQ